jgi:hypothetical protein
MVFQVSTARFRANGAVQSHWQSMGERQGREDDVVLPISDQWAIAVAVAAAAGLSVWLWAARSK